MNPVNTFIISVAFIIVTAIITVGIYEHRKVAETTVQTTTKALIENALGVEVYPDGSMKIWR